MQDDTAGESQRYVIYFREHGSFLGVGCKPTLHLDCAERFESMVSAVYFIGFIHTLTFLKKSGPYIGEHLTLEEARKLVLQ